MPDLLKRLANAPVTGPLTRALGLPAPPELEREEGAYAAEPLDGKRVIASGTRLAREPLEALGANRFDATEPIDVLILDATDARDPADLDNAYTFFHEHLGKLAPCAKVLILGPDPQATDGAQASTARALEGFTRSLAKELGRKGGTANLLQVAPEATDRLLGPLRFLSTPRSAYVSGQVLRVSDRLPAGDTDARPLLAGQRALVTGAARGLGAATARRLAAEGATVVGVDLPSARSTLQEGMDEIGGEAVTVDITSEGAATVLEAPDVLVHNAGVTRDRTLKNMTEEEWETVLEVNLRAIQRLDRELLPEMPEGGRAIYMSSVNGIAGSVGQTNYAATKAGLIGYVEAQAPRLAERAITANAVAPGFIRTAMTDAMPALRRAIGQRMNSLRQAGEPEDVAEAVTFLASPDAHGVTGETLRVCGQSMLGR